jgi:hypothetical protein
MQANDIALILAAACALATFSAHDIYSEAPPDQHDHTVQTAMATAPRR